MFNRLKRRSKQETPQSGRDATIINSQESSTRQVASYHENMALEDTVCLSPTTTLSEPMAKLDVFDGRHENEASLSTTFASGKTETSAVNLQNNRLQDSTAELINALEYSSDTEEELEITDLMKEKIEAEIDAARYTNAERLLIKVLNRYEKTAQRRPNFNNDVANTLVTTADVYMKQQKWDNALEVLNKARELLPSEPYKIETRLIEALLGKGMLNEASQSCTTLLKSTRKAWGKENRTYYHAVVWKIRILLLEGERDEAEAYCSTLPVDMQEEFSKEFETDEPPLVVPELVAQHVILPKPRNPTIRFIPHEDSQQETRPSLQFPDIELMSPQPGFVFYIGRYSESKIAPDFIGFKSKVVSRRHCQLSYQNGRWGIADLASSSGTFINSRRLSQPGEKSEISSLNDGDVVQLGINFRGGEEPIFRRVKFIVKILGL